LTAVRSVAGCPQAREKQHVLSTMNTNRDDALRIFHDTYRWPGLEIYEVGESGPESCALLRAGRSIGRIPRNCWFVWFSLGFHGVIGPSRLVCIAKSNGAIVFDGDASDEG
jgi:hypothetical protein